MSLSPHVTPFVPKYRAAGESNDISWKLSAETSEFVPSWLNSTTALPQDQMQMSNDVSEKKYAKTPTFTGVEINNHDVKKNTPNSKKQKATSSNINGLTNSSKVVKNHGGEEIHSDSEFPALRVPVRNEQSLHAVRKMQFGVSFSEKVKSSRSLSYFDDDPPKQFQDLILKEQGNSLIGNKEDCKNKVENDEIRDIESVRRIPTGNVSENEEFSLVKSKSKKMQKNKSSHFEDLDWKSGGNKEEEPRTDERGILNYESNKRARQPSKHQKDYCTFKSAHKVSESESRNTNVNERLSDSACNVGTTEGNAFTGMSRLPLSYSDILRSKPDHSEMLKGNERGTLKVPSEEEVNVEQVEEQDDASKKKKRKKKKKSTGEAQPQPVKKSKEALTLDFGDMFAKIMESSSMRKKPILRTGGMLPVQAPLPPKETRITKKSEMQVSNTLDSTAPIVFHSKEREVPKKKKPSAMRKTLMKDREEKKRAQEANNELNSEELISEEELMESNDIDPAEVKKAIHSRKFREYCDQDLDYDINGVVIQLLKELIRFQDRLFHKDPVKAKARRRFVCGLREVHKHAKLKKLKCVIVTPNLEPTKSRGGLDDLLSNIIDICHSQNVPVVFALNRQVLGKVLLKKVPVSIVGIFYYDGAQDYFKRLMTLTEVARETYKDKFNKARDKFVLEKQMAKDLALIEAGLESTKIQNIKDEILKHNEGLENTVDLGIETKEDSFDAEKTVEDSWANNDCCQVSEVK